MEREGFWSMNLSGTNPIKTLHCHEGQGQVVETFSLLSYQKRNTSSQPPCSGCIWHAVASQKGNLY
jgi:hypothetical protein